MTATPTLTRSFLSSSIAAMCNEEQTSSATFTTTPLINVKPTTTVSSLTSALLSLPSYSNSKVGVSDEGKQDSSGTSIDVTAKAGFETNDVIDLTASTDDDGDTNSTAGEGDGHEERGVRQGQERSASETLAMTFFDDMVNARPPPLNISNPNESTSLPELYHDFFESHYELLSLNHHIHQHHQHHHHRPSLPSLSESELSGYEGESIGGDDDDDDEEEVRLMTMDLDLDVDMMDLDMDLDEEVAQRIRDRAMEELRYTLVAASM
ncbi:hypothetical protein BGZ83_006604 [Gryganskiella cystojenkinii]|nr:hypothetical protein BGZ83_006604 [Gryganskiella cystojenkinii]